MTIDTPAPQALSPSRLLGMRRGLEKESLRIQPSGALAGTPHPLALGAALTHPHITTDFSEAQLELITGVHPDVPSCLHQLAQIQRYTMHVLGEDRLWVCSMPCTLPADAAIPLGHYGRSNAGQAKTVYRRGLGYRYGRRMQTISGIHYNWSLPDMTDAAYFGLIRNFRRHAFLLLYLFGASPAVCASFVADRPHPLQTLTPGTLYLPYATSLRMGRLGYQSEAQATLNVSYNNLTEYADALQAALTQPYPAYAAIGVRAADGSYRQLTDSLLQIENEFYGTIRPKRVLHANERPLHALRARGVEYVEVRLLDLNPFEPLGIGSQTLHFLDVFLLHCLLTDSPPDSLAENAAVARNLHHTAERGREPGLLLERGTSQMTLTDWGQELVAQCLPMARQLDAAYATQAYTQAVQAAHHALQHPATLPSARVLQAVTNDFAGSFVAFAQAQSQAVRQSTLQMPLPPAVLARFQELAQTSLVQQSHLEAADTQTFDDYLHAYLAPDSLLA